YDQVEERLLQHRAIQQQLSRGKTYLGPDLDTWFRRGAARGIDGARDDGAELRRARMCLVGTHEIEKIADDVVESPSLLADDVEQEVRLWWQRNTAELGERIEDDRHRVSDLVGYDGGELAQRCQTLLRHQVRLRLREGLVASPKILEHLRVR